MHVTDPNTKFCVFDTESTGLFDYKLPADDPSQPRLASAAFILLDGIHAEPREFGFLVKPDGWVMTAEAEAVNGLSMEILEAGGTPVADVLDFWAGIIGDGYNIAAYNAQHDCKMIRSELRRAGRDDLFTRTRNSCLMRPMTSAMKGQRASGAKGWPKLAEACEFFGIERGGAHTAMGDARDAMHVLRALFERQLLPYPDVHFAKGKG